MSKQDMYIVIEGREYEHGDSNCACFLHHMTKDELEQWLNMKADYPPAIIDYIDPDGDDMEALLEECATSSVILIIKGGKIIDPKLTKTIKYEVD